jgi:hypothetical protein
MLASIHFQRAVTKYVIINNDSNLHDLFVYSLHGMQTIQTTAYSFQISPFSVSIIFTSFNSVTNSQVLFHDGTLLHSKSQYTTVKHSRQLLEHTYTSYLFAFQASLTIHRTTVISTVTSSLHLFHSCV